MTGTPGNDVDIDGVAEWYHSIDLGDGRVTPGWFDCRPIVDRLAIPASLSGMRCLDVGTFDGFWAFEMERRGAAEVVAVDILDPSGWDWPVGSDPATIQAIGRRKAGGRGFEIAAAALGSSVRRLDRNVYDLDRREVGTFDFVYVGSLLLHLRDPVRALERVRGVCTGTMLSVDAHHLGLTTVHPRRPVAELDGRGRPWWWKANVAGLVRMVEAAGFEVVDGPHRLAMPPGAGRGRAPVSVAALRTAAGRAELLESRRGDPHVAILARPRATTP